MTWVRFILILLCIAFAGEAARAGTLEDIHARGVVTCALPANAPGIAQTENGKRKGLAVDLCAIFAAAVLGQSSAVSIVEVNEAEALSVLQAGEADVLLMPAPWRFGREVEDGVLLVEPMLHRPGDGAVLGPTVRQGDDAWFVAVRWILAALRGPAERIPEEARKKAADGLGLSPEWPDKISEISDGYESFLSRHMSGLSSLGWIALPAVGGQQF